MASLSLTDTGAEGNTSPFIFVWIFASLAKPVMSVQETDEEVAGGGEDGGAVRGGQGQAPAQSRGDGSQVAWPSCATVAECQIHKNG